MPWTHRRLSEKASDREVDFSDHHGGKVIFYSVGRREPLKYLRGRREIKSSIAVLYKNSDGCACLLAPSDAPLTAPTFFFLKNKSDY